MAYNLITGTEDGEDLVGTSVADRIIAGGGNDAVDGYDGNDLIYGQDGDDIISSGAGDDRVYGGAGNDFIVGGFVGGNDFDRIWGGAGNDIIGVNSTGGVEVYGGSGYDIVSMLLLSINTPVSISLGGGGEISNPGGYYFSSVEALTISTARGDDTITGGAYSDLIAVHAGANTVRALGGDDFVQYYTGSANVIDGGGGSDTLQVVHFVPGSLIFSVNGNAASDNFGSLIRNVQRFEVSGARQDDRVSLGNGNDFFRGYAGNDAVDGGGGNDVLDGDQGRDTLNGGMGADRLYGDGDGDSLSGGDGNDSISGGGGQDTLIGGNGRDLLIGGTDADVFVLDGEPGSPDTVRDLESGTDRLWIDSVLIGGALPDGAVDMARLNFENAFGGEAQFVYVEHTASGTGRLYWDANGEASGGLTRLATLSGMPALTFNDLLII